MMFVDNFIKENVRLIEEFYKIKRQGAVSPIEITNTMADLKELVDSVKRCKIFRINPEQVNVFYEISHENRITEEQMMYCRLPFNRLFIDFQSPIAVEKIDGTNKIIRGAMLQRLRTLNEEELNKFSDDMKQSAKEYDEEITDEKLKEYFNAGNNDFECTIFTSSHAYYTFRRVIGFNHGLCENFASCNKLPSIFTRKLLDSGQLKTKAQDGNCIFPTTYDLKDFPELVVFKKCPDEFKCPTAELVADMSAMIQHIINYINARNVEITYVNPNTSRRIRDGKTLMPYHEINIKPSKVYENYNGTGHGTKHSYRYDVRGHFRKRNDGFYWVSPHQRGTQNLIYRPKTWRKEREEESLTPI